MNSFSSAKTLWMLAVTVVVAVVLIELQRGGRADEAAAPQVDRDARMSSGEMESVARPPTTAGSTTAGSTTAGSTTAGSTTATLPNAASSTVASSTAGARVSTWPAHQTIRRLPAVAASSGGGRPRAPAPYWASTAVMHNRSNQKPGSQRRISQASWNDGAAAPASGSPMPGAANRHSAEVTVSLPRTADDGHVYENDLPSPNQSVPVSLHLSNVDVRQALDGLCLSHDINMLVSPGVSGSVTANLEGLDSDEALNAILKLCKLVAHRENGLVYVYSESEYPEIDFQVRTFPLDYIAGTDVLPVISSLLSSPGQAFATEIDPLDNSKSREAITIIDMPRVIQRAAEYIRQVDVPPLQVMIEAHVLQVILNEDLRHGINYNQVMQAVGSGGIELDVVGFADPTASPGVFARLTHTDIGALLHFLKETTDSKTLASPRVMVINGQTAKIQVGEQIPYKVITVTETTSIEEVKFLDVGVVLEVTPRISHDGRVMMRVKPKVSDGKFDALSSLPGEETREVQSDVLIRDGEGLVIGGLIQEKDSDIQTKVPWLGDLHYIGRLFQKREKSKIRSEIVITLIPRIRYADGFSERELVDQERTRTPLFHGPLHPAYRPWEPMLPDAVNNPVRLPMYGKLCRHCASAPCACQSAGDSFGPEKPLETIDPSPPGIPTEAEPEDSLAPPPVSLNPAGFVTPQDLPYEDYLSPPPVHVAP